MFVSPDVPALIATLQALVASVAKEGEHFPDVRVGMAYGPATTRGGDWFGAPVNVASRVTEIAGPGASSPPRRCATWRPTSRGIAAAGAPA